MTQASRRSALYMPGSNARALEKARQIPADSLIFDLEDAVAPDAKVSARAQVCEAVTSKAYPGREVVIRINAMATSWGPEDLSAACAAGPDAILVPKVEGPDDIVAVARRMEECAAPEPIRIWAMMETPRAILNALAIADASRGEGVRLAAFVMGTNDLAKDTSVRLDQSRAAVIPWLMTCVAAARANGLAILDGVYNRLDDGDGFVRECEQGRGLGMDGKTLIHPTQVEPCNRIFSPSDEDIAWAASVQAAFDDPASAHAGVVKIDGQMIERLHLDMARRILAVDARNRRMPAAGGMRHG
ncbi:HpcH/HpaI aldolase/citrate lyase family protein [Microvirga sp. M2]|uniref:HpcH/HpaI aldolase/citrate lyase family protein n=1 Tax=Microvirga sp. M2 TaxID=3073270 RepID=UPI0039C09671